MDGVLGVDKHIGRWYIVGLQCNDADRSLSAPQKGEDMLSLWDGKIVHENCLAIKLIGASNAVRELAMVRHPTLPSCCRCVQGTTVNGSVKTHSHIGSKACTVLHTDVTQMRIASFGVAKYFVTLSIKRPVTVMSYS